MVKKVAGQAAGTVDIEFEDNVPFPGRRSEYVQDWNIEAMKVNQSFFIPLGKDHKEGSMRHALASYCTRMGRQLNRHLVVAKDERKGQPGFRIFRFEGDFKEPEVKAKTKKAA